MPEYEIHMLIRPVPGKFETVFLKRTVNGDWLPRQGEPILISGGWSEDVRTVWHEPGERTVVEIGHPAGINDAHNEGLADMAREAGWA